MPRRSFLMRHATMVPLSEEVKRRYLLHWHARELYRTPEAFPRLSSGEMFGNDKPLQMEIGCGTADFLIHMATAHSGTNFLGIDINLKALHIAADKAARLSLDNIRFIKAPVQYLLPLLVPGSLEIVYIHFPDPCLHPKYRKRRLFNRALLDALHQALTPEGRLSVVTDSRELLEEMLELVEADPRFVKGHKERYLIGYDPPMKSRYQLYWEGHGVPIYRFIVGPERFPS